ncbi:pyridoxamine 5'-phosphate oxidase [Aquabacterium fontiphilum]|uniref:pyridoxamine 5'-phosphate oxidase n=1 Tax=Aquabacterium fontiphilum TaxID=450365 RepID=UPI001378F1B8|nr:pyridoxamine 5'-phosphate oxidase [Aquabacterium fontiphilum]NBD20592.1 pyridoxamine 5'-phosphate oxidase [Aquabacterium fontiphilum]
MDKTPHDLAQMRRQYELAELDETHVAADPLHQFQRWFDEAVRAKALEPNAMTLATVSAEGRPSTRVVLLKGLDERGLVWYTNYESRKGAELAVNPHAALQFFWPELERVVRVEGVVSKLADAESDEYYRTRPLGSRIGAWASPQSQVIPSRAALEATWAAEQARQGDDPVRPPQWGGYRLQPLYWEFWQGRASRLHDRLVFQRTEEGAVWQLSRLAP